MISAMDNLTIPISMDLMNDDFFEGLYDDTLQKRITISIFFIGAFVGLVSEMGIIWYERHGNHQYRTVINQLFATISWLVVGYILFVYIPDGIRYLIGPLNATFCDVHHFLKNFFWSCTILTLDCIIALRYIFIFKWTKVATVNDDLIASILQLTIVLASVWAAAVKRISIGRMPMNYFMCTGKDPNKEYPRYTNYKSVSNKLDTTSILVCVSFILHLTVYTKIFWYQRKMEKKMQSIQLGRINSSEANADQKMAWSDETCHLTPVDTFSRMPKSMADLTTQISALGVHVIMAILILVMNQTEPIKLNDYSKRWIVYINQIIGVAAASVFVHAFYYVRNTTLSKFIWRNIKERCQK